jgi:hypothetical protein
MPQPMECTPLGHQNHMVTNDPPNLSVAGPALAIVTGERFGIKILTAIETAELLPHYPGFGVQRYHPSR